jgi:two-component system chemotaxis response regulator CheB
VASQGQIRVLVVDDSVVMRRIVARTLERHPSMARTEFAPNGAIALTRIAERRPDLVVLDLEMPVMDGFRALEALRRTDPRLPVVLFSSLDKRVATATIEALSLGPTDFVVKPSVASIEEAETYVAQNLTPLILALASPQPSGRTPSRTQRSQPTSRGGPVSAVVLGTSTGGPDALSRLVAALPADLPVPVLVVQHMPPMFTLLLAERLHRLGGLSVREAQEGDVLAPGTVYIAPGNRHLEVAQFAGQVRVVLNDGPPENSCRPAADVLFRSAVSVYGARTLAVVLTGMGHDGLRGCECVRAVGGQVIVQDPTTALIPSMPGQVLEAGLAHAALPLAELAEDLVRRVCVRVTR